MTYEETKMVAKKFFSECVHFWKTRGGKGEYEARQLALCVDMQVIKRNPYNTSQLLDEQAMKEFICEEFFTVLPMEDTDRTPPEHIRRYFKVAEVNGPNYLEVSYRDFYRDGTLVAEGTEDFSRKRFLEQEWFYFLPDITEEVRRKYFSDELKVCYNRFDHDGYGWFGSLFTCGHLDKEEIDRLLAADTERAMLGAYFLEKKFPGGLREMDRYLYQNHQVSELSDRFETFCAGRFGNYHITFINRKGDYNLYVRLFRRPEESGGDRRDPV